MAGSCNRKRVSPWVPGRHEQDNINYMFYIHCSWWKGRKGWAGERLKKKKKILFLRVKRYCHVDIHKILGFKRDRNNFPLLPHSNFLINMWLFSIWPFRGHDYDSFAIFNMWFSRPLWKSPFQPGERIEDRDLLPRMCIEANRYHSHLCNISKILLQETWDRFLGLEDPLEKEMATVSLPGESHGQSSLAGYCLWGHKNRTWLSDWAHAHHYGYTTVTSRRTQVLSKGNNICLSYNSVAWK